MRSFIRHPAHIPIEYDLESKTKQILDTENISAGGLCFKSDKAIPKGTKLRINIPHLKYPYEASCFVAWCKNAKSYFEIGVCFDNAQSDFRLRMIEQICYIEEYRLSVLREENRELTWKEASDEWIKNYADKFPGKLL